MPQENFSEKVSVNVNSSVLSSIDLLVDHGYFSNRSDFINHALRTVIQQNQPVLERIMGQYESGADATRHWFAGVYLFGSSDLEKHVAAGETATISGYGVLVLENNLDVEKLFATVKSIQVKGKVLCSQEIKDHYGL